jgi:(2Fe-2S) ferredoxin
MERRYLLVCRGPDCKAQGSQALREAVRAQIAAARARGEGAVEVVVLPYTCFDRCGRGPNAVVYPDGVWYEGLEAADLPAVVRHVLGGPIADSLLADVADSHRAEYAALFAELIPEIEAEEGPTIHRGRGWWPFGKRRSGPE